MVGTPTLVEYATLVLRQDSSSQPVGTDSAGTDGGGCSTNNDYDGRMGVRISAIFVILLGSTIGAMFPVFARGRTQNRWLEYAFFVAKYFGSGVIIATAFIHLLAPANEALSDPCLTGVLTLYPFAEGIALIMIFLLFFIELLTLRYAGFGHSHGLDTEDNALEEEPYSDKKIVDDDHLTSNTTNQSLQDPALEQTGTGAQQHKKASHAPGTDHFGHGREHIAGHDHVPVNNAVDYERANTESYASQLTAIFILEFGVIFHSVFIGLTLAVSGDEFITLYIVLVFHQTFEGLGLGTRLAQVPWPKTKRWTPYILALGYGISTPVSIAIGLGVRTSFVPGSRTALVTNGVFDSISAGILVYTGLVELMAHEFMFSPSMRKAPIKTVLMAFGCMTLGAGIMALLGRWA